MTIRQKTIEVLKRELECVKRQDTPDCCRDEFGCGACDLVLSPDDVIKAYENALATMIYFDALEKRLKHLLKSEFIRSFDAKNPRTKKYVRNIKEADAKILYLCDGNKCNNDCYIECKHTTDITHAKNFEYKGGGCYWEKSESVRNCPKLSEQSEKWILQDGLFICPVCKSESDMYYNFCPTCGKKLG